MFLEFMAPTKIKGRKVLFIEGRNDNKMLVRRRRQAVDLSYDRAGRSDERDTALSSESLHAGQPDRFGQHLRLADQADPTGHFQPRSSQSQTQGQVLPQGQDQQPGLHANLGAAPPEPTRAWKTTKANAFVDDELHVPIRVEALLWPKTGRRSQAALVRVHLHRPAAQRRPDRRGFQAQPAGAELRRLLKPVGTVPNLPSPPEQIGAVPLLPAVVETSPRSICGSGIRSLRSISPRAGRSRTSISIAWRHPAAVQQFSGGQLPLPGSPDRRPRRRCRPHRAQAIRAEPLGFCL